MMKEINGGKQMKSVWEVYPPAREEKRFGKHPTQKPVALLERILQAASNPGDLVLDPFMGSGTTLLTAFRLRRRAMGCDLSLEWRDLSIRRICSDLVQVEVSVSTLDLSLDLFPDPMDRSSSAISSQRIRADEMSDGTKLVQQDRRFYFIGRAQREVIFSVFAVSLDEAIQRFRASGHSVSEAIFIIKTDTEIYLT
ncbi:MAG TPA: site-specific DNA-methyltransferase [Candidatus Acidoferrales bacterium]|nr:site-specific DNA-methyltransferase [Candidatus Acidoferrales bacterium]